MYDRLRGVKDGLRRLKAAGRCTVEDLAHYQAGAWAQLRCAVGGLGWHAAPQAAPLPTAAWRTLLAPRPPPAPAPQGQLDRIDASRTDGVFCGNMEVPWVGGRVG